MIAMQHADIVMKFVDTVYSLYLYNPLFKTFSTLKNFSCPLEMQKRETKGHPCFCFSCHVLIITSDMSPYKEEAVSQFVVFRSFASEMALEIII